MSIVEEFKAIKLDWASYVDTKPVQIKEEALEKIVKVVKTAKSKKKAK